MIFTGADNQGYIKIKEEATLPSWTSDNTRELIYVTDENTFYLGGSSAWIKFLDISKNLSDLADAATARTNLGLGTAAVEDVEDIQVVKNNDRLLFPQNTVPTGWTFVSTDNDRAILNTNVQSEGGDTGGSWTLTGITIGNHSLTTNEMPSHDHPIEIGQTPASWANNQVASCQGVHTKNQDTGNTGSGNGHDHSASGGSSWRPKYVKCITCRKN